MAVDRSIVDLDGWTGTGFANDTDEFTARWHIRTTDLKDGPEEVYAGAIPGGGLPGTGIVADPPNVYLIPRFGDYTVGNDGGVGSIFKALGINITRSERGSCWWFADVDFANLSRVEPGTYGTQGGDSLADPLARPVHIGMEWVDYEVPLDYDADTGEMIVNIGPGDPVRGLRTTERRTVLTFTKNWQFLAGGTTANSIFEFTQLFDSTQNSDAYRGAQPKKARFLGMTSPDELTENGVTYYRSTYRVEFKPAFSAPGRVATYEEEILNTGMRCVHDPGGANEKIIQCKDADGNPVTQAVRLTDQGEQAPPGVASDHIFNRNRYRSISYTGLD